MDLIPPPGRQTAVASVMAPEYLSREGADGVNPPPLSSDGSWECAWVRKGHSAGVFVERGGGVDGVNPPGRQTAVASVTAPEYLSREGVDGVYLPSPFVGREL